MECCEAGHRGCPRHIHWRCLPTYVLIKKIIAFFMSEILGLSHIAYIEAMSTTERQVSVASANLANADTPGYKARALSFSDAMGSASESLRTNNARHIPGSGGGFYSMSFRDTDQARSDGNTVVPAMEKQEIKRSSQMYQLAMSEVVSKSSSYEKIMAEGK